MKVGSRLCNGIRSASVGNAMGQVHLLVNPVAGAGKAAKAHQEIADSIRSFGHEVIELNADRPDRVQEVIRQAKAEGMTRLVIVGGDGLVHYALPALAGSKTVVGIVSAGTGNDFARSLGLPTKTNDAVKAALGEPSLVDLLRSKPRPAKSTNEPNEGWVATVATSGFSGDVNATANGLRFPRGKQRYTVATLINLGRLQPSEIEVTVDGVVQTYKAILIAVANTKYFGGGMAICPEAKPNDGLVHFTIIEDVSPFTLARLLPTVFFGRHIRHPRVSVGSGETVEVESKNAFWADGEPFGGKGRVVFSADPKTLLVAGASSMEDA